MKVSFSSHSKVHELLFTFTATTIVKQASALTEIFLVNIIQVPLVAKISSMVEGVCMCMCARACVCVSDFVGG